MVLTALCKTLQYFCEKNAIILFQFAIQRYYQKKLSIFFKTTPVSL